MQHKILLSLISCVLFSHQIGAMHFGGMDLSTLVTEFSQRFNRQQLERKTCAAIEAEKKVNASRPKSSATETKPFNFEKLPATLQQHALGFLRSFAQSNHSLVTIQDPLCKRLNIKSFISYRSLRTTEGGWVITQEKTDSYLGYISTFHRWKMEITNEGLRLSYCDSFQFPVQGITNFSLYQDKTGLKIVVQCEDKTEQCSFVHVFDVATQQHCYSQKVPGSMHQNCLFLQSHLIIETSCNDGRKIEVFEINKNICTHKKTLPGEILTHDGTNLIIQPDHRDKNEIDTTTVLTYNLETFSERTFKLPIRKNLRFEYAAYKTGKETILILAHDNILSPSVDGYQLSNGEKLFTVESPSAANVATFSIDITRDTHSIEHPRLTIFWGSKHVDMWDLTDTPQLTYRSKLTSELLGESDDHIPLSVGRAKIITQPGKSPVLFLNSSDHFMAFSITPSPEERVLQAMLKKQQSAHQPKPTDVTAGSSSSSSSSSQPTSASSATPAAMDLSTDTEEQQKSKRVRVETPK